ncbi:sodium/potassium-transporting ATPase subunit beta-1 [Manduca sexta]|nr:sodium/potassium-transporting ATPase subunit beta-1 [Manduca sexta]
MASKSNGVEHEWVRGPPPGGSVWKRFGRAIYNSEEKSFLGRTGKRWGILFAFYTVFYSVLALLFALCMGGLFLSLDDRKPTHILDSSLIGANPGVTCRPYPIAYNKVQYDPQNFTNGHPYINQLQEFFTPYETIDWYKSENVCVSADNYGFPETPCFFIKINKIYGWSPDCYTAVDLPEDMPDDLVEHIKSLEPEKQNQVWITCVDESHNSTKIEYPWGRGLASSFYPFNNTDGYQSPLVAVKITPAVDDTVSIRCRAWAKNIIYNKSIKEQSGYTRILLHVNVADNTTDVLT